MKKRTSEIKDYLEQNPVFSSMPFLVAVQKENALKPRDVLADPLPTYRKKLELAFNEKILVLKPSITNSGVIGVLCLEGEGVEIVGFT